MNADSAAMRMSHASAIAMPAPAAGPGNAATVGLRTATSTPVSVRSSISGFVETTSRQPLANVTVRLIGGQTPITTKSNADGSFVLPGKNDGTLYFYRTATDWDSGVGPVLDLQRATVKQGHGEFTLMHAMAGPGYLHLQLLGTKAEKGVNYADVYFGTGDNVWRKK